MYDNQYLKKMVWFGLVSRPRNRNRTEPIASAIYKVAHCMFMILLFCTIDMSNANGGAVFNMKYYNINNGWNRRCSSKRCWVLILKILGQCSWHLPWYFIPPNANSSHLRQARRRCYWTILSHLHMILIFK